MSWRITHFFTEPRRIVLLIARLEAGGVGATVTTLQRIADTLGLALNVELHRPAA